MDRAVTASIAVLIAMRIATTTTTAVSGTVTTTNAVIGCCHLCWFVTVAILLFYVIIHFSSY